MRLVLKVSLVGGSGYTGSELLRILLRHPCVNVGQVTSERNAGAPLHSVHPNLRKVTDLMFTSREKLEPCDVLFLAVPHGTAMKTMPSYMELSDKVIDLSADFRLRNPEDYPKWYGYEHSCPELLDRFVYGVAELHRKDIKGARYASGPGCLATATILGLLPLFREGVVDPKKVIIDAKIGSSAAGHEPTPGSHHPDRSRTVRLYAGTGHRHTAEIMQELSFGKELEVSFSAHAIELVRGISATCHVFLESDLQDKDIWRIYRSSYGDEPFMRIVKDKKGVFRYPEPKVVMGTNYCDVGFERDSNSNRLVVVSAIDNLVKGAAGSAVQSMNLMCGFEETTGLDLIGMHPV